MALPTNITVCTVTGTFSFLDGTPIEGLKVTIEPDPRNPVIQDITSNTTFPTFELFGITDSSGVLKSFQTDASGNRTEITGIKLAFPNDTDFVQKNWSYNAVFFDPSTLEQTRLSFVPVGGVVDLSDGVALDTPI